MKQVANLNCRLHTGDMPYKCDECDFASVYKDKYNTHVKIHLRAKGMTEEEANTTLYYYCDKCGKQFTNQYREVQVTGLRFETRIQSQSEF